MADRVHGNSCLSCLFRFLNLFLIPVGLGTMITGIYVSAKDKSFSWYDGSFIAMGLTTIIIAFIGHKSKFSLGRMTFYCGCLLLLSAAMISFSIAIISYSSLTNKLGASNADAVRYSLLSSSIIMVVTFFMGVFYRNSLKLKTFEHDNDPKRKFISMPEVTPKTDKRREEMKANEYDRGVNTFSPEGRLFQVEYAIEAIKLGSTAIGITCKQGVVLAVERRVTSPLIEPSSIEKLFEIDSHIGCAMSGILADARTLVDHARSEAQSHRFVFTEPMRTQSVAQIVCDMALNFGEGDGSKQKPMARPYGVALLIAGVDKNGPGLFTTDPSGTLFKYKAKAIGSAAEGAQTILEEEWNEDLDLNQAVRLAAKILKQVMEEAITPVNVEIAVVSVENKKYQSLPSSQVAEILASIS